MSWHKRILIFALVLIFAAALAGCGNKAKNQTGNDNAIKSEDKVNQDTPLQNTTQIKGAIDKDMQQLDKDLNELDKMGSEIDKLNENDFGE